MNRSGFDEVLKTDVLVIGGGIAGMTAALGLAPMAVTLVTKSSLGGGSSSELAQGGVAVALSEEDSSRSHTEDTLAVGGGLCSRQMVDIITSHGPRQIGRLREWGARFDLDRSDPTRLELGREAAHSHRRIVHANGDSTGAEIVRVLNETVRTRSDIRVVENCLGSDLVVQGGRVVGMVGIQGNKSILIRAGATILATGGIGALFAYTTNPDESTGDGLAMAARANAVLADLEFMQFHPTALACTTNPLPLLTEALRGEGAILVTDSGERFMLDEHPLAELAPRDTVARAIWNRLKLGKTVHLDATEAVGPVFPERFPTVFNSCRSHGVDPRVEPMPCTPAAHYHIGGVQTNAWGETSAPGLWACGETAATAIHGANRLASNSLLEALVFGARVAESVRGEWRPLRVRPVGGISAPIRGQEDEVWRAAIRRTMWENVGLIRSQESLERALQLLDHAREVDFSPSIEVANMLSVALLVTTAALIRQESRGVHYRSDFPATDPAWERHVRFRGFLQEAEPAMAMAR